MFSELNEDLIRWPWRWFHGIADGLYISGTLLVMDLVFGCHLVQWADTWFYPRYLVRTGQDISRNILHPWNQ